MDTNKVDEALREKTHAHISSGDMKQPSEKEASRNARITNIIQYYISSNPVKTLRRIAFNFIPKTKKFDCLGRGDLTFLFFSKVVK